MFRSTAKRYAGPAAAIILVGLIIVSFVRLKEYRPFGRTKSPPMFPNVGLRLENARLIGRSNGAKSWAFNARLVEVSRDRAWTTFIDLTDGVVFDNNKPAIRLKARKVTYGSFTKDIVAEGNIRLNANKLAVATDLLTWRDRERKLACPRRLSIDIGAGKGSAGSLVADLRNDSLVLTKIDLRIPSNEELVNVKQ